MTKQQKKINFSLNWKNNPGLLLILDLCPSGWMHACTKKNDNKPEWEKKTKLDFNKKQSLMTPLSDCSLNNLSGTETYLQWTLLTDHIRGCSTVVEQTSCNMKVVGSNSARRWTFFFFFP